MTLVASARAEAFASQAERAADRAYGYLTQGIETARRVADARNAVDAALSTFALPHRWTGTRLELLSPSGAWVAGPELRGDVTPEALAAMAAAQSAAVVASTAATAVATISAAGGFISFAPAARAQIDAVALDRASRQSLPSRETGETTDLSAYTHVTVNRWSAGSRLAPVPYEESETEPTHAGKFRSADGKWWRMAAVGVVSVLAFGVTQTAAQSPATRIELIQAALDYGAAEGVEVTMPAGTLLVRAGLQYNGNQRFRGAGMFATVLKLSDDAPSEEAVIRPKGYNADVAGARISDMTVHGNAARLSGPQLAGIQRPGGSGVSTNGSQRCVYENIHSVNCQLHCFDDCSAGTLNTAGTRRYYYDPNNFGPTVYASNPARFNQFVNCSADDPGDDCFTTHYQEYSFFVRCTGRNASQRHTPDANNSNGFEADDGSYGVWFIGCMAYNVNRGFVAKAHDAFPPAKLVYVSDCLADGCAVGLLFNNDDTSATHEGGVNVSGFVFKNPTDRGIAANTGFVRGVWISGYKQVNLKGLRLYGRAGDATINQAINIDSGAGIVNISDFYIEGFASTETSSTTNCPINITSSAGVVHLSNGHIRGFNRNAIRKSGSPGGPCTITDVTGEGNGLPGSEFVSLSGGSNTTILDNSSATGVDFQVTGFTGPVSNDLGSRRLNGAIATGGATLSETINKLELPVVTTVGSDVLRVAGATAVARFYETGAASLGNAAAAAMRIGANAVTSRGINSPGSFNAAGADYAEYHMVKPHLYGSVAPGAILAFAADGLLTDRYADIVGRCVIKSTKPYGCGGDDWGSEERVCASQGCAPVGLEPEVAVVPPVDDNDPDAVAGYEAGCAAAQLAFEAETVAWRARKAAFAIAYEAERARWDRIAKAGYVPVNIEATAADIGKHLIPVEDGSGGITAEMVVEAALTFGEYVRSIGTIIGIAADGRPLVEVKTG